MRSTADITTRRANQGKQGADHSEDSADSCEDPNVGENPDENENNTEHDHAGLITLDHIGVVL